MKRGNLMMMAKIVCFIGLAAGVLHADYTPQKKSFPNIVYLYADDMGYGDVSCLNPEGKIKTVHLDKLASEGIIFTNAHSPASTCQPSRYGLMTGRLDWRRDHSIASYQDSIIDENLTTWPMVLQKAGYQTAAFGKWHLGMKWPWKDGKVSKKITADQIEYKKPVINGPLSRGFDYYFGAPHRSTLPAFIENRHIIGIPDTEVPSGRPGKTAIGVKGWDPVEYMPTVTRKVASYIEDRAKEKNRQPFFVYFAFTCPHVPFNVIKEFEGRSGIGEYADFVMQTDHMVGQVVEVLKRTGLDKNTLVIFTSDNGSPAKHPGANKDKKGDHSPNMIYRGRKGDAWEGGHRIPFIAKWPGRIKAGTVTDELFCQADMLATCAALTGQKKPAGAVDSFNGLPLFFGETAPADGRTYLVHEAQGTFHSRKADWKLIFGTSKSGRERGGESEKKGRRGKKGKKEVADPGTWELYDLGKDPSEKNNLYGKYPEVTKQLEALLKAELEK